MSEQGLAAFSARLAGGAERRLDAYRGQVLLVVNTASRCGFTPQYAGLQRLQDAYGARGFSVLAFPCDQFGRQEPGGDTEIVMFCTDRFGVTFPVFAKVEVNGPRAHPLFVWLKRQKGGLLGSAIKWNFTKFLIDRQGRVRGRFAPTVAPDTMQGDVEALL